MGLGMKVDNRELGVCFSGGAALGFAHLGVIRAFEELGISPRMISGASMGAIIGSLYSFGHSYEDMLCIIEDYKFYKLFNVVSPNLKLLQGFSSHENIEEMLINTIPHNSFEKLRRKFFLSVTDIMKPSWEIIDSGELIKYILASMSIPLLFEPKLVDGRYLVDGGVMNNLPVEPLKENNCFIIGIDVQSTFASSEKLTSALMAKRYYGAMMVEIQRPRVAKCDIYIDFPELESYDLYDFSLFEQIIEIGYRRAIEVLTASPHFKQG